MNASRQNTNLKKYRLLTAFVLAGLFCASTMTVIAEDETAATADLRTNSAIKMSEGSPNIKENSLMLYPSAFSDINCTPSQQSVSPLRFTRIYVPSGAPEKWPRDPGRYLPVKDGEFEQLLQKAKASSDHYSVPQCVITKACYQAKLADDGTLKGTARLQITLNGQNSILLPINPCCFVITEASWENHDGEKKSPSTSALLGTNPQGQVAVLVERSGIFVMEWSLRSTPSHLMSVDATNATDNVIQDGLSDNNTMAFSLELPQCPSSVLILDLPRDLAPQFKGAIVATSEDAGQNTSAQQKWRVELGGHNICELLLTRIDNKSTDRPAVPARQTMVYNLSEQGLEVSSAFQLGKSCSSIDRVNILVDHPLQVIQATCGDKPMVWSVAPGDDNHTKRVTLKLPLPLQNAGVDVRLRGYCPVVTDRTWRLPRIIPKQVFDTDANSGGRAIFWEQGEATLLVEDPLEIIDFHQIDSRQLKSGRLPAPAVGESLQLQLFSANGPGKVVLSLVASPPKVDCGISAVLDAGEITAKVNATFSGNRQKHFLIRANMASKWLVDSVKSLPEDAIEDWEVENNHDGSRQLVFRLAKPLSSDRGPLQLLITLHNPRSVLGKKISLKSMLPLTFTNCREGKTLLAIDAAEPNRLQYWGDTSRALHEVNKLLSPILPKNDLRSESPATTAENSAFENETKSTATSTSITTDDLKLFADPPKGLIAVPAHAVDSLRFSLQRQLPPYDANIVVEARIDDDLLRESYRINCQPLDSSVERVLINFTQPRDSAIRWQLNTQRNHQVATRRLSASEVSAAGLRQCGETWEVTLQRPCEIPFEIRASRTLKISRKTELCLAALPEASQQKGTLFVKYSDLSSPRFKNQRLEPIGTRTLGPDRYSTVRAAYRYDPQQAISSPNGQAIAALPKHPASTTKVGKDKSAWVWAAHLQSLLNTDGSGCHSAAYRIENAGRDSVYFQLPKGVGSDDVKEVCINDKTVTWHATTTTKPDYIRRSSNNGTTKRSPDSQGEPLTQNATNVTRDLNSLQVNLPEGKRFVVVRINFNTSGTAIGACKSYYPPTPLPDIPTLSRSWMLWLPPGYFVSSNPEKETGDILDPNASLSIMQRIFGPLGQSAYGKVFDPFAAADWRAFAASVQAFTNDLHPIDIILQKMGSIFQKDLTAATLFCDESLSSSRPFLIHAQALANEGILPGTILSIANDDCSASSTTTQESFADGHLPPAPLPPHIQMAQNINGSIVLTHPQEKELPDPQAAQKAVRLLRRNHLALLLHEKAIVLTTSSQAAVFANQLHPLGNSIVWRVKAGPLHDWITLQLSSPPRHSNRSKLLTANEWAAVPKGLQDPWLEFGKAIFCADAMPGWTAVRLDISGETPARMTIVHRRTLGVFQFVAFMLAVSVGCWKGTVRLLRIATTAAVFAIIAIFTPIFISNICSGIVLGLLLCLLLVWFRQKSPTHDPKSTVDKVTSQPTATTAAYISAVVILIIFLLSVNAATAQDISRRSAIHKLAVDKNINIRNAITTANKPDEVYSVLVPVAANQDAIGGRIFVPEAFYKSLLHRAATSVGAPRDWLITSAAYHGELVAYGPQKRLTLDALNALFEITLFDSHAEVHIPLDKNDVTLLSEGCLLDGRRISPRQSSDGKSLIVEIDQPGRHRLELVLDPVNKRNRLDIAIARLPKSRLELVLPVNKTTLLAFSTNGSLKKENGMLVAEFGGCNRMKVAWQDTAQAQIEPSLYSEELVWLKISPGAVVVDAKFLIRINSGEISELVLEADPRLRLLEHSGTTEIVDMLGNNKLRIIHLPSPCSDRTIVTARFLLRDGSGIGNLRPPRLRLADMSQSSRLLAVSIDPDLKFSLHGYQPSSPANVADFLASWGPSDDKPQFICSPDDVDYQWSIATRPRQLPLQVSHSVRTTFGQKQIDIHLDADITDTPGRGFQYQITAPKSLKVDNLSITEEGVERVSRWTRANDGAINVFLNGAAIAAKKLSLEAHMSTPKQGIFRVPLFHFNNSHEISKHIELFRKPEMLISVDKHDGLIMSHLSQAAEEANNTTLQHTSNQTKDNLKEKAAVPAVKLTRLAGSFIGKGSEAADLVVTLKTNRPKATVSQLTSLLPADSATGSWIVQIEIRMSVSEGIIDALVFDVPDEFSGPYELVQPGTIETVELPDRQRQLLIRPSLPLSEKESIIKFRGVLMTDVIAVPRLSTSGTNIVKQTLCLPEYRGKKRLEWETSGLKKTDLTEQYDVVEDNYQARLLPYGEGRCNAVVRLADINVIWRADGSCYGVAAFDLMPDGSSWCPLWVPNNLQLVAARVNNVTIAPWTVETKHTNKSTTTQLHPGSQHVRYRLSLASQTMPQRIEIVFQGQLPGGCWPRQGKTNVPRLGDLNVEETLWRVAAPQGYAPCQPNNRAFYLKQDMIRLHKITEMTEISFAASGPKTDEIFQWYRFWAQRYAQARHTILSTLTAANSLDMQHTNLHELQQLDARQLEIAKAISVEDILHDYMEREVIADDASRLWQINLGSSLPTALLIENQTHGTKSMGNLSFRRLQTSDLWNRCCVAAVILILMSLVHQGVRRGILPLFIHRWPYLLGVLVGLFWWLCLTPSVLGLVIAAVCLTFAIRFGRQNELRNDSKIVPLHYY